ncbi:MAG TPA: hypothetical protein VGW31_16270 [Hanamia sp.]|nr:hypothetical protein [Hanamia sp.]
MAPLLISFCFTVASFAGNAGDVYGEKTNNHIGDELPVAANTEICYAQPMADLLYLQQQRSVKVYFNYVGIMDSGNDLLTDRKSWSSSQFLIPKFLYCKSIGLILIFPKHYFF